MLSIGGLLLIVVNLEIVGDCGMCPALTAKLVEATIKTRHIDHGTIGQTAFLLTQRSCYRAIQMRMIVKI